jgi:hypothetical protein
MSCVIVGAGALTSVLAGYLQGADIAPILVTTGGGLFAVSIWWALSGKYLEAWIFGSLAGFNVSYALLQFGISNGWYGIPFQDLANVVSIYVATWLFLFVILTLAVSRESAGMTVALFCMISALALVLTANLKGSVQILHWAAFPLVLVIAVATLYILQILNGWRKRDRGARERARASREIGTVERSILQSVLKSDGSISTTPQVADASVATTDGPRGALPPAEARVSQMTDDLA